MGRGSGKRQWEEAVERGSGHDQQERAEKECRGRRHGGGAITTVKQNKQWKWTGSEDEQGKGTTRVCRGTNDRKEEEKGTT